MSTETTALRPIAPAAVRIRCDQNRLFGCGRWVVAPVRSVPIGASATGCMAFAWCSCSLPLSKCWTLYPTVAATLSAAA